MRLALERRGAAMVEEEVRQLMSGIDVDHSNGIDHTEFLAATISHSKAKQVRRRQGSERRGRVGGLW